MTGNQPGHRVVRHGIGHGPHRARRMDMLRKFLIRHHASRRNTQQRLPDLDLKIGPAHVQVDAGRMTAGTREQAARERSGHAWCFLKTRTRPFGHQLRECGATIRWQ